MPKYINSVSIKETQFSLKISAPLDKLIEELKQNSSNGCVNLEVKKRRTPSEKGATHYMQVDDWRREQGSQSDFPRPEITPLDEDDNLGLPF